MGYIKLMDARKVNTSPVPLYSLTGPFKGHMSFKSNPYCPGSSSKLTSQYLIEDHMVSHYKKVYSAKASVDSTVPKSLLSSVKYTDQQRRERLKKDVARNERRAHSVRSLSQKSARSDTRPSSTQIVQSRASMQWGEAASPCLDSPMLSTPRFTTTFHSKQVVYPSQMGNSWSPTHHCRSASEFSYRSPNSQRQLSARSCFTSTTHNGYKSFQDPVQKTYSGDLLQKHSHHFTEDKPFTPRTLKTGSKSFLSQYRYYTPPRGTLKDPRLTHQDTYHGSTNAMGGSPEDEWVSLQEMSNGPEWSDEESQSLNHSSFGINIKEHHTRWRSGELHSSSRRISPDRMKSPSVKKVTGEEEELMYLEFITDVTNDILSRGLYSNRVMERVFARQMEMNKHRLDEDKMRHLLEVLRKDLASPSESVTTCSELEEIGRSYLSSLGKWSTSETKENSNLFACTMFDKVSGENENSIQSLSIPVLPEDCAGSKDLPGHRQETEDSEECNSNTTSNCKLLPCEQTHLSDSENNEESTPDNPGQSKEVEELERNLAESLGVSDEIDPQGVIEDKHKDGDLTVGFLSDEEF